MLQYFLSCKAHRIDDLQEDFSLVIWVFKGGKQMQYEIKLNCRMIRLVSLFMFSVSLSNYLNQRASFVDRMPLIANIC